MFKVTRKNIELMVWGDYLGLHLRLSYKQTSIGQAITDPPFELADQQWRVHVEHTIFSSERNFVALLLCRMLMKWSFDNQDCGDFFIAGKMAHLMVDITQPETTHSFCWDGKILPMRGEEALRLANMLADFFRFKDFDIFGEGEVKS